MNTEYFTITQKMYSNSIQMRIKNTITRGLFHGQRGTSKMGFTLRGKNLLQLEQIFPFNSLPPLGRETNIKWQSFFAWRCTL